MTDEPVAFVPHSDHVRLLAGMSSSGRPVYELVPALLVESGVYDVIGSPGLACGCAAGDRIRVAADGQFEVMRRGGNLCLVVVPPTRAERDEIAALRSAFGRLGGLVEVPATGRFIVITIPVAAGFPAIEETIGAWASIKNADWYFGNVYDDEGRPLNWWADQSAS